MLHFIVNVSFQPCNLKYIAIYILVFYVYVFQITRTFLVDEYMKWNEMKCITRHL